MRLSASISWRRCSSVSPFRTTTGTSLRPSILLSFAQFEREVIGERIRDKFAASRRKGIWMGGWAPLGYDIKERKLIVNEPEARLVQSMFRRFARGIQPQVLVGHLAKEGALNKNGKPIDKSYLYRVLHNRVYLGEAVHKGTAYPGEHQPIIERNLWEQVHALISASPKARTKRQLGRTPALLKGLIFGPTGSAMTPAYTRRGGRLYRYYVAADTIRTGACANPIRRIQAAQIEAVVVAQIKSMLQSPEVIVATWRAARKTIKGLTERQVAEELRRFDNLWSELFPAEQARIVQLLVERVDVSETGADITLKVQGLASIIEDLRAAGDHKREAA
jgi:site-specific DNA recombinase